MNNEQRKALVKELTTLVANGSDNPYAVMNARVKVNEAIDRAVPEPDADRSFGSEHHQSLIQAIWKGLESSQASRFGNSGIAHRIADHVEGWLLERQAAVPTVQSAAGDDLDALEAIERQHGFVITEVQIRPERGEYRCDIYAGVEPDDPMMMRIGYGTGPTRIAAIISAVNKAKGVSNE